MSQKIKTVFLFGDYTITVMCTLHFGKPFIYTLKNSNIFKALEKNHLKEICVKLFCTSMITFVKQELLMDLL